MLINGHELTVNDREPTADDLAEIASRYTMARMPEAAKRSWSASAKDLRTECPYDGWNPYLGLETI
jgi:hypothetical protein